MFSEEQVEQLKSMLRQGAEAADQVFDEDLLGTLARLMRRQHQALVKAGFSSAEATQIVAHNVPSLQAS